MARIDDLLAQVENVELQKKLLKELAVLRQQNGFGLVFEHHRPEITLVPTLDIRPGETVGYKNGSGNDEIFRVLAMDKNRVTMTPVDRLDTIEANADELIVVKEFGTPAYPVLTPLGAVERGGDKPFHAAINAENFHALQLMTYMWESDVDCIYIDPPYNTGARDWKYNNRYVDSKDQWRHSKWLSMMERRLLLAKRLLKPNGVLVITIDENELNHLGMLLEQLFPEARIQPVTITINPSGASGEGLSRVEEYAYFCFFGDSQPVPVTDDMLTELDDKGLTAIRWESLMRGGGDWYRATRKNLCYPILLNPEGNRIVGVGKPFDIGDASTEEEEIAAEESRPKEVDGCPAAWPVRLDGRLGIWRVDPTRLMSLAERGLAYVSSQDSERGTWTIRYVMEGTVEAIDEGLIEVTGVSDNGQAVLRRTTERTRTAKTIWRRGRHTAGGAGGTHMLASLLGGRGVFNFPKSVYSVRDCLTVAVGNRKDAFIVDFFAGSGTTMHAVALMNAEDGGSRRCVVVTNNEVGEKTEKRLNKDGHFRGDPHFEGQGIFEKVMRPRLEAAITGHRADGTPAPGHYLDGTPISTGFQENLEFFRLDYLNPDDVELGRQFDAIQPSLWLSAGALGKRPSGPPESYVLPADARYGILLEESALREFAAAVSERTDVTHLYLVTDSETSYAEMCELIGQGKRTSMLYRDYLRNFKINTADVR